MKTVLLVCICVLLLVDIGIQGAGLYRRRIEQKPEVITVKAGTTLDLKGLPLLGDANASKIIVEISDFECPYCLRYAKETLPALRQELINRGKIRYAHLNLPLPIHRNATLRATAAICAGKQNQYWTMYGALIETPITNYSEANDLARSLGLGTLEYDACLHNGTSAKQSIANDRQKAQNLGVTGTPAFAVGILKDGKVLVKKVISGARPLKVFESAIEDI
jgi:protein-disulfide isomerase